MKYLKYDTKVEYDIIKYEMTFKIQKRLKAKRQLVQNKKNNTKRHSTRRKKYERYLNTKKTFIVIKYERHPSMKNN